MKNTVLLFSYILFASQLLPAQNITHAPQALDTIYANEQKNVALFFPDPIRQGITGSENFVFTYNREKEQHLGLLQATPGKESNLLVISNSGSVFSYIVKYSEELEKINYFISDSGRIGKENQEELIVNPEIKESVSESKSEKLQPDKEAYYRNFSSYLLRNDQRIDGVKKRKDGILLSLENMVFQGEELYFEFKIKNGSTIDFEPNFLNISVETRQKGKKKSIQKIIREPLIRYNVPAKVKAGKTARFIYVLPKFSIAEDKMVVVDLNEISGERGIKLKIKKKIINNPN